MSNRQMPTVTARFDRNPLNVSGAAVCHLVVEVTAPKAEQTSPQTQRPLNLGLVIDASGSMQSGDAELGFSEGGVRPHSPRRSQDRRHRRRRATRGHRYPFGRLVRRRNHHSRRRPAPR